MIDLAVKNLKKYYSANMIFDHVTFDVKSGEKIGLIGANGSGKTTILKIVAGMESAEGELFLRKGLTLGYLEQLPTVELEDTVLNVLNTAFGELNELKHKITQYEMLLAQDMVNFERTLQEYGKLQAEFERLDGYNIDEKINRIVKGLDLDNHLEKKFNDLSGGERTKVMLGKVLLMNPDLLLLDEPTNHLDIDSREILEETLSDYQGTIFFVSHDRYFINKLADRIGEIKDKTVFLYDGDYSYYKDQKNLEQAKPKINTDKTINVNTKRSVADSNIITSKPVKTIQKKQTALEAEIMELEDAINNLETEMEKNPTDHEILGRLYKEKTKTENLYLKKLMEHEKIANELKNLAEREEKIR